MTSRRTSADFLRRDLHDLQRARAHLRFSYDRVRRLASDPTAWTSEEAERVEAFTARFARVVDLLTNTVLRALFRYELEPEGTALDRVHLAEKRGFVDRAEDLRLLKEQRNVIAHDYAGQSLGPVFGFCVAHVTELEAICDRVASHAEERLASERSAFYEPDTAPPPQRAGGRVGDPGPEESG